MTSIKRAGILLGCLVLLQSLSLASNATVEETVELPIIMYHQINPAPKSWGNYVISPDTLEADLKYLKANGYTTVTTEQLIAYTQGKFQLPDKPILITFDDGYESFGTYALPLFEKYQMTAVLAIVGRFADDYTKTDDHNLSYSHFSWPALETLQHSSAVELAAHTYDMHSLKKRKGCKIMQGENVNSYRTAFNHDLDQLEQRFTEYIGTKPTVFAYPYGLICSESKKILQEHGYRILFTCNQRINLLSGDPKELLNLGRFNRPSNISTERFFKLLSK